MEKQAMQQAIEQYINAYNNLNVANILATLHAEIEFKNIANGEVTLSTKGLKAFKVQAQQASQFFKQRQQTITDIRLNYQQAKVFIDYQRILAADLPIGLKSSDTLALKGKSIFRFENNLIIFLEESS